MSQSMNASKAWLPAFEGAKADDGVTTSVAPESTSNGLGDAVGDWRPVSVGAQRLEMLAKLLGIRFKKAVCRASWCGEGQWKWCCRECLRRNWL